MTKVIAIANQKGGVGKTTTSINFSTGLALAGPRVLLIDLDPQAHSTIGLGVEPGSYDQAVHDALVNRRNIREIVLDTSVPNLFLAPSNIRLDKAEQQLTPEMFKESRLHKAIRNLDYDFIVIDCRPTLGTLTINALYACNFIIVPCEMAMYALEGFSDLMETIENVKNTDDSDPQSFVRILLTKFDSRKTKTNTWVMEQLAPYREILFNTKIRQNEALVQSQIAKKPINSYDPSTHGAHDYEALTKEFLNLCQENKT